VPAGEPTAPKKSESENSNDNLLRDTHKTVITSCWRCLHLGLTGDINALTLGVNLANRRRRGPARSGWLAFPPRWSTDRSIERSVCRDVGAFAAKHERSRRHPESQPVGDLHPTRSRVSRAARRSGALPPLAGDCRVANPRKGALASAAREKTRRLGGRISLRMYLRRANPGLDGVVPTGRRSPSPGRRTANKTLTRSARRMACGTNRRQGIIARPRP